MSEPSRTGARFTLVTSAHVCNNPRLVKEADALHAAGYRVRVVAMDVDRAARANDDLLMTQRPWPLRRVAAVRSGAAHGWLRWALSSLVQRFAWRVARAGWRNPTWVDRAYSRYVGALAAAASEEAADVVVAHNLEALPAAARASTRLAARLVFDIEDFHSGDVPQPERNQALVALLRDAESRYLPQCDALLASAQGIADEIVRRYDVRPPTVVLNAFPLADRSNSATDRLGARRESPSLYWYSQTIGPGRGLEEAIAGLGFSRTSAHLYLRGRVSDAYRKELTRLADASGVQAQLHFLAPAPADDMVALAAEHDIGLALEQPDTRNRQLCVTNKILTYLAAGIAVIATDTQGQREVMAGATGAGRLYPAGDAQAFARALSSLLESADALDTAHAASSAAAVRRYSWERERGVLIDALRRVAEQGTAAASFREPTGVKAREYAR